MIFAARNLTQKTVEPSEPWLFQPTEDLNHDIRTDKEKRQQFYRNPKVRHNFYTTIEAANANQRVSRDDNPPRLLCGIAVDYDVVIEEALLTSALAAWTIKPSWTEKSLGGKRRVVWLFPRPLPVESYDFCVALLQRCRKWLSLDQLPGLDEPALTDPTRLLCNGCDWTATGHGPIAEDALQAFFVAAGREYRFVSDDGAEIPLDVIEKALAEKFPNFCWPDEFVPESSGPSFWIPGSQSSRSAILKTQGFFTFSAHAEKSFYTWTDILGAEFVGKFTTAAISKATLDVYYDGRKFWRRKKGVYTGMDMTELQNYLKVTCGIGVKGGKLEQALAHIYEENAVENASPYLFRPSGPLMFQGKRRLNTSVSMILKPAPEEQIWGPTGNFPFLSSLLDNIFTSAPQRDTFLAWWQYFYVSGLESNPMPGQVVFLMGGVATGKTFTSREIVGRSVGGFVDASGYILKTGDFNSHLFEEPLWVLDDTTISDSPQAAANVQAMLKKSVANGQFLSNKKFQVAGMVEWAGRVIATTNLDYISSRMLGPLDNSSLDKISVFRCQSVSKIRFPSRAEQGRLVAAELPYLLRWLADHVPPDYIERDSRFGYKAWHEPSLMEQAQQTSKSAPFREILMEALEEYFRDNANATEWRGTLSRLVQLLHVNPLREHVIRALRLEQISRYLEAIEHDGALNCRVEVGPMNTRLWSFPRFGSAPAVAEPVPAPVGKSIFDKP